LIQRKSHRQPIPCHCLIRPDTDGEANGGSIPGFGREQPAPAIGRLARLLGVTRHELLERLIVNG
jgi:hypothetical protein